MPSDISISIEDYRKALDNWAKPSRFRPVFPRRPKSRLIALHYLSLAFDREVEYSEQQVDRIIESGNMFSTDHVQLRRHLVDYGLLEREADGSRYFLADGHLNQADWDPVILDSEHLPETPNDRSA